MGEPHMPAAPPSAKSGLRSISIKRAMVGDLGSPRPSTAGSSGGPLQPLQGMLQKRHRSSKVLPWGKRYFRVDDQNDVLCYHRSEAQLLRQDPVLKMPLRNLAAVRAVELPSLAHVFELRFFSQAAQPSSVGRSCGLGGQQRSLDGAEAENEYEISDKQAPRRIIVRAETEAEAEMWIGGLQERIARRWRGGQASAYEPAPLDPSVDAVCRALGAAVTVDDHRCRAEARPVTPREPDRGLPLHRPTTAPSVLGALRAQSPRGGGACEARLAPDAGEDLQTTTDFLTLMGTPPTPPPARPPLPSRTTTTHTQPVAPPVPITSRRRPLVSQAPRRGRSPAPRRRHARRRERPRSTRRKRPRRSAWPPGLPPPPPPRPRRRAAPRTWRAWLTGSSARSSWWRMCRKRRSRRRPMRRAAIVTLRAWRPRGGYALMDRFTVGKLTRLMHEYMQHSKHSNTSSHVHGNRARDSDTHATRALAHKL